MFGVLACVRFWIGCSDREPYPHAKCTILAVVVAEVINTRSMLRKQIANCWTLFDWLIDWLTDSVELRMFHWINGWNPLIAVIDWNSIRWRWSISNNLNESMTSMKYETDTVYYEWYFGDVANLVDRSGKKQGQKNGERERKQGTIVNQNEFLFSKCFVVCLFAIR